MTERAFETVKNLFIKIGKVQCLEDLKAHGVSIPVKIASKEVGTNTDSFSEAKAPSSDSKVGTSFKTKKKKTLNALNQTDFEGNLVHLTELLKENIMHKDDTILPVIESVAELKLRHIESIQNIFWSEKKGEVICRMKSKGKTQQQHR